MSDQYMLCSTSWQYLAVLGSTTLIFVFFGGHSVVWVFDGIFWNVFLCLLR